MNNSQKVILIIPFEAIVEAAFVGSLSLSFQYMSSMIPNLNPYIHVQFKVLNLKHPLRNHGKD